MRKTRRVIIGALLAAGSIGGFATAASAHIHGFTPLGCLTTDSDRSGAAVGFERAADEAQPMQGGPIIPENASGKRPSGGQGAEHACG